MQFRSTNSKASHFGGDVLSNTDDSSHGVQLMGGSTGGIVQACGDETDIALTVRGKGAGALNFGAAGAPVTLTSTSVTLNSTEVSIGGSTTTFIGMIRTRIDFTVPALSSGGSDVHGSSIALAGCTTNSIFIVQPRAPLNSSVVGVSIQARCSTAGAIHLTFSNNTVSTLSGSTMSAYLLEFRLPAAVP